MSGSKDWSRLANRINGQNNGTTNYKIELNMDKKYTCYCGLYCENCAVKVKVEPASKVLYNEMKQLGFEEIMPFFPDGEKF